MSIEGEFVASLGNNVKQSVYKVLTQGGWMEMNTTI